MNPRIGWALVVAGLVAGYAAYGLRGVALALSATAFWLLLQFSRTLRVMRMAARAPIGRVANSVMLHARLQTGMTMLQVLPLTGSLGVALDPAASETYRWTDGADCSVVMTFARGRLLRWTLERPTPDVSPL